MDKGGASTVVMGSAEPNSLGSNPVFVLKIHVICINNLSRNQQE